jgi:hypothetical protein
MAADTALKTELFEEALHPGEVLTLVPDIPRAVSLLFEENSLFRQNNSLLTFQNSLFR